MKTDENAKTNNYSLLELIFRYNGVSPPPIAQTDEFKKSIVKFVNSNYFKEKHQNTSKEGFHSDARVFPTQYFSCFDIKSYSYDYTKQFSKNKLNQMTLNSRLESIRLIEDLEYKLLLIKVYRRYILGNMYAAKFIKIVKREFPELNIN